MSDESVEGGRASRFKSAWRSCLERRSIERLAIAGLAALALFGTFASSEEPIISALEGTWIADVAYSLHYANTIVFNLSVGTLVSIFLWWLLVGFPQQRTRRLLRRSLQLRYSYFKEETILILLQASGEYFEYELADELLDHEKFKSYFKKDNDRRWYAAINGLQGNDGKMNDLLVEMELLSQEIAYVLSAVEIDDEAAHAFFKRLSTHLYKLRNHTVYTNDQVKYLSQFIWEILARWSYIDGQRRDDIVQTMIGRI
jgi:hypothetical protein